MAKRKTTTKPAAAPVTAKETQEEDVSKLAALVEAEEQIEEEEETTTKGKKSPIVYLDESGFLPEDNPAFAKKESEKAADAARKTTTKKTEPVDDNEIDTMGNVQPDSVVEDPEVDTEELSTVVNETLPNKPAPEQVQEEVKTDAIITRAAEIDAEAYTATQNLDIGQAPSSTQTNRLDELPVPAAEQAMNEREMHVRRIQDSNMPILGQNSSASTINRNRPINVFQKLAEVAAPEQTTTRVRASADDMAEILLTKLDIDVNNVKTDDFLRGMVDTLNTYVRRMSPRSPIPADQMLEQQKNLTRLIATCFEKEPSVGVAGLQILEEYARAYSNGAFGGTYPFRSFNSLAPKYSELSNVLYAIQNIVKDGKATALRTISRQKLKESAGTQEGQVILISYLNS